MRRLLLCNFAVMQGAGKALRASCTIQCASAGDGATEPDGPQVQVRRLVRLVHGGRGLPRENLCNGPACRSAGATRTFSGFDRCTRGRVWEVGCLFTWSWSKGSYIHRARGLMESSLAGRQVQGSGQQDVAPCSCPCTSVHGVLVVAVVTCSAV